MPIEYSDEERALFGMRPGATIRGGADYNSGSHAAPPPVDDDGIPFLSHRELGGILGRSESNSQRLAWESGINQHIEFKGQGDAHRVWFSTQDVKDHVDSLLNGTHPATANTPESTRKLKWEAKSKELANTLKTARLTKQSKINNNEPVFDTHNQPHRGNKNFADNTVRGRRVITNRVYNSLGDTIATHDLQAAIDQGNFRPIKRR